MMNLKPSQPIGIFDSGIGGLTIARELIQLLPNENIFYFGDTEHFPYGDKSLEAIKHYSLKIGEMLLKKNCKLILIACNSASAAAYDDLKRFVGNRAIVVNVIDPVVNFLADNYKEKKVGLIGTRLTVSSGLHLSKINSLNSSVKMYSKATPLLASVIEEGFYDTNVIDELLNVYLNDQNLNDIGALVLACTHYHLIKNKISSFYKNKVDVIDASRIVAMYVKELLSQNSLLHSGAKTIQHFYISDYTDSFAKSAKNFFSQDINIERYALWSAISTST